MSKYTITRTCGHTETINIGGKVSERDRMASNEAGKMCMECYQAKLAAERAAASGAAAQAATASGMPDLVGSPKQIAWAQTIRADLIGGHQEARAKLADGIAAGKGDEVAVAMLAAIDRVIACNSAKWFIDHRTDAHAKGMVNYIKSVASRLPKDAGKEACVAALNAICK